VLSAFAFFYFLQAMRFDLDEVARLPQGSTFYDRAGNVLSVPGGQARQLATRNQLPPFLIDALIAREDARFYQHHGIDLRGLLRAALRNLKDREFTQGASTLTMQLARNTFGMREKSLHRKWLEIALTLRIEARFPKDDILTHYLNRIYFGAGAEGITQAAQTYFGKPVKQLTDGECAILVGIIRGPHIFSPLRNPQQALEQRKQTLDRMVSMGFIDEGRRDAVAAEPLRLAADDLSGDPTSYVLQAARRELNGLLDAGSITAGGLHVYTTIDAGWQERLERELERTVATLERQASWPHGQPADHRPGDPAHYLQYAAVTTETKTGNVLALVGGRHFGHSRFDRTRAQRDLGPVFEPFIVAAVAERGRNPSPGNPLRTGRAIGPAEVARIARRCGFAGPFVESDDLFRGALAATPMEASIALATLGNDGRRPKPRLIREIRDAAGVRIHVSKPDLTAAISAEAAREGLSALESRGGTRWIRAATGSERDAWALRLGPSGSTAIWIGLDAPAAIASQDTVRSMLDECIERLGNR
jgi:penicillin-binding protein 1A